MKTSLSLILTFLLASASWAETVIPASQTERLNGRVQYGGVPGSGAGSLKFVDQTLPQPEVRVGPSNNDGVGLGYLMAFEFSINDINELLLAEKVEIFVHVNKTALGGAPSPLVVALLTGSGGNNPAHFAQFGAWNDAPDFEVVGNIDGDPELGEIRIDVTDALRAGSQPSTTNPVVFFAIYSPMEDLRSANGGRHVIFEGQGNLAPRLIISE